MISSSCKLYCSEDISLIENYEQAVSSDKKWVCHHRFEIQDGKLISYLELKEKGLYFKRPASELIFLSETEHKKLHGTNLREETKKKMSDKSKRYHASEEAKNKKCFFYKGMIPWNYGLPSPMKGTKKSKETIEKMKIAKKNWWKNHVITEEEHKRRSDAVKKVAKPLSEEAKEKLRNLYKGKHWKLVDGKRVWVE